MTVRAVFDASAMLGYANLDQAMPVGELIMMVNEENQAIGDDPDDVEAYAGASQIGIPTSAFVTAYAQTDSLGRSILADLAADLAVAEELGDTERSTFVFLPLITVADVLEAAELELRCWSQGDAMHHALRHDAVLATFAPPKAPPPGLSVADLSSSWNG